MECKKCGTTYDPILFLGACPICGGKNENEEKTDGQQVLEKDEKKKANEEKTDSAYESSNIL